VLRAAFPRRKARLVFARGAEDLATLLRTTLVDSAVIDLTSPTEDTWRAVSFAADHPSAAFFAIAPLRAGDAPPIAECATRDFAGALVEGVDDLAIRDMVLRAAFSSRFERALAVPPPALRLDSPLQRRAWEQVVAHAGRPVRTAVLASVLEVTREHLSRSFAAKGSPNLKRVIDLVRLIAAAELEESRPRSPGCGERAGVCISLAPLDDRATDRRHQAGVADAAQNDGYRRSIRSRPRPEPVMRPASDRLLPL
jgi:hypothetical protein